MGPERPWKVPVIKVEGLTGAGVSELAEALASHRAYLVESGELGQLRRRQARSQVEKVLKDELLRAAIRASGGEEGLDAMVERVAAREIDPRSAARELARASSGVPAR
jgi:LAO/AO transport system kinase